MKSKRNHPYLFQLIAPAYGWFYNSQRRKFIEEITFIKEKGILNNCKTILDVGCGTGALSSSLEEFGYLVAGIDPVKGMIKIAKKRAKNQNIDYFIDNVLNGLSIEDNKFDISVASYVAHGLKKQDRISMYKEMKRVTKDKVLLFEYNQKRNIFINIIEFLEGGDYFNFIKEVKNELNDCFEKVTILPLNEYKALYICDISK